MQCHTECRKTHRGVTIVQELHHRHVVVAEGEGRGLGHLAHPAGHDVDGGLLLAVTVCVVDKILLDVRKGQLNRHSIIYEIGTQDLPL